LNGKFKTLVHFQVNIVMNKDSFMVTYDAGNCTIGFETKQGSTVFTIKSN